ncbi:hypothetical protein JD844_028446 [Phrynosoma platyrhinos]|uniref:DNA replication licensing factor MCM5 n=1 Tax=Phrynosoma platyrhinos TaxID=52577 RepID=A0ABQ7SHV9_PHRPL|nr:hypothetical protein JD844_028446 [Phrynosoma platyrhinos]
MSGFDDPGIFYSDSFGGDTGGDEGQIRKSQLQKRFKEFLRQYRVGTDRTGFTFKYRDDLKRHYNLGQYWIEVEMEDLASFDEDLADYLYKQPAEHLQLLEEAAKEVADEITRPRPVGEEDLQDIQVMLRSDANPSNIRSLKILFGTGEEKWEFVDLAFGSERNMFNCGFLLFVLQSEQMSHLVKIPGIIIAATAVRAKATKITIQCRSCRNVIPNIALRPGLEGYALPRKCTTEQNILAKCPLDPYFIVPDKCKCVDFQTLKLQESPDAVPHGEMPRHMQLYCDRYLCDKVVPGNRVTVMGIYSIKKAGVTKNKGRDNIGVGIRSSYIRVVGIQVDTEGSGRSISGSVTPQEEEEFRRLASMPNIYETIAKSIAPSIYGSTDIKKAIACMLFGAKSQLLKFVERCSPIGVYTSGKGSSAAGLTASVIRDPSSRSFFMEGGAMVLADGGVVCIDEFDKMREDDRVAIHEAMEQQTISIAKAGITTTLNSRCSVLAAANSVFGRWDETKGEENIDFMPTILSRFDMIFIVKDEHNEERDMILARHVMSLHVSALTQTQAVEGEIELNKLKKMIAYCRTRLLHLALHLRRPLKPPKRRTLRGRSPGPKKSTASAKQHHSLDRDDEPAREKPAKKSKVRPEKLKERHGPKSPPPTGSKSPSPSAVPSVRSPPVLEAVRQSPLHRPPHFVLSGSESEGEIREDVPAPTPGPSTLHRDRANLGTEAESSPLDPETEKILQDNPNLIYDSLSNQFLMRVDPKTLLSHQAPPQVQVQPPRAVSPSPSHCHSRSRCDLSRSRSRTPQAREHHTQGHRSRRDRKCGPRLSAEAAEKLKNRYILMRSGVEGFTTQEDQEMLSRIEKQLKRRFAIGSQVSEHNIFCPFVIPFQKYPEHAIYRVLQLMMRRGEIQHRLQRKVLYRVK